MIIPVLARKRPDRDLVLAALRSALEQIPAAAFVAHEGGEVRYTNAAGDSIARGEPSLHADLANAMAGVRNGDEPRYVCTPLDGHEPGWFLIVEAQTRDAAEQRLTRLLQRLALTPRQREVALLLLRGATNLTIAELLGISERTVETHLTAIYQRAGVENRASLVSFLLTWGRAR